MLSSSLFSNDSSKNSTKIQRCHHRTSTQLSCPSILAARLTDTTGQQRAAEVFSFLWRHSYDYFLSPRQLLLVSDVWPPSPTKLQAGIRTKNCFFHVFEQSLLQVCCCIHFKVAPNLCHLDFWLQEAFDTQRCSTHWKKWLWPRKLRLELVWCRRDLSRVPSSQQSSQKIPWNFQTFDSENPMLGSPRRRLSDACDAITKCLPWWVVICEHCWYTLVASNEGFSAESLEIFKGYCCSGRLCLLDPSSKQLMKLRYSRVKKSGVATNWKQ